MEEIKNQNVRIATKKLFERYLSFSLDEDTKKLCQKGIELIEVLPIDKLSRWLGYVQAIVIERGLSSVDNERDFSRPLFHEAYKKDGIKIPESIDVKSIGKIKKENDIEKFKDIKNIIFDFDGVICESQEYHLNKLNEIFNLAFTMEEYAGAHHGNSNVSMREIKTKWAKVDWNKYHEEIEKDFPLKKIKPEVKETLKNLAKKYNLFIISSGHNQHIIDFLKNNEVWDLFKRALFLEDAKLKIDKFKMLEDKFEISSNDTLFITDTIGDVREAREVGYKNLIGITTGHHDEEILTSDDNEENGKVEIIHLFKDLEEYL